MDVAALIVWVVTALGGFYLLGTWLAARGRSSVAVGAGSAPASGTGVSAPSRLPTPLVFGHFLLAAAGLVLWIVYLATDSDSLAWVAFGLLVVVALGGFTMFARWIGGRRGAQSGGSAAPEDRFPVAVVAAHGVFAATTLVLVLLAALEVGGS